jgi:hypothetical protein
MNYKLLRADFATEWQTDTNGNLTDTYLKSLGFTDEDIANFIEFGYITSLEKPAKESK